MRSITELHDNPRIVICAESTDGGMAKVLLTNNETVHVFFSWGAGWDRVSVSHIHHCPTKDEMCEVKGLFFRDGECVMEYHTVDEDHDPAYPRSVQLWRPHLAPPNRPPFLVLMQKECLA